MFRAPHDDDGWKTVQEVEQEAPLAPEALDFQSLKDEFREQQTRRKQPKTDFQSLRSSIEKEIKPFQHRTATDLLVDALTPIMIFLMVSSVIFFLLDVRYVYTAVHDANLRFVALAFVLGVVALNRLIATDGSDESILYGIGLAGAIGFYTFATTGLYDVGSVSRNFMNSNAYLATAFNMVIVAFIWWLTNRLMHECCVDENRTAGDIGILTGTARRVQNAIRRTKTSEDSLFVKKNKEPVLQLNVVEAVDPTEWKEVKKRKGPPVAVANQRLSKRHPGISIFYFSIPVLAIFAFGLRIVQHGGRPMILAGNLYLGLYVVAALMLLMLTSLGGLRQYFRTRYVQLPAMLGPFWIGLGVVMIAMVLLGALRMPQPDLPAAWYVDEHQADPWKRNAPAFTLNNAAVSAADQLEQSRIIERLGNFVLFLFALFVVYAAVRWLGAFAAYLGKRRDLLPPRVRRLFDLLDRLLQKLTHVPSLPKRTPRRRVSRQLARCTRYRNPMAKGEARPATPEDDVAYTYDALCALAADMGVPRRDGQTPFEFIQAFPKELRGLRDEALDLTELYVRAAYSPYKLDRNTEDRLRRFWITYDRIRNRVVH
jgi:hypothetical protein